MTSIVGLALIILGLAIGFIISWAFGVLSGGVSVGLVIGLLLLVAGAIVGFVSEWLIDEAYRKNRELQQQLRELGSAAPPLIELSTPNQLPLLQPEDVPVAHRLSPGEQNHVLASETFTNFLRQRDEELREMRQQLAATDAQIDTLRHEFEIYQRTHPDNLRVIKGIGPVYQWKLRDAGINTYKQLALANPDQIRRLLNVKKWQRVNTEAWVEQARDWAQRGP